MAAIADQNIEPDRRQRQDQERNQERFKDIVVAERPDAHDCEQRHAGKGKQQQQPDGDFVLPDRENRRVSGVARLVLAVLAIEH